MTWIHEINGWPEFTWSMEVLGESLARVRHKQGRHLGRIEDLGFPLRGAASLSTLTEEVVKSSAIEGEVLDRDEVRSSIARRLGMDLAGMPEPGRMVEGVVEMMLDATRKHDEPLTAERLFAWHAALFPTGHSGMQKITVGAWRPDDGGTMRVISRDRVHFEAPPADRVDPEMGDFLRWFAEPPTLDPFLRAGIAHFWFVTIHPFDLRWSWCRRRNGRVGASGGRAISDRRICAAVCAGT